MRRGERSAASAAAVVEDEEQSGLVGTLARGIAWSSLSNLVVRLGTLAIGIVVARILSPAEFGVYAVALTVQAILMTLADFGLSADLIRSDDPEAIAPTISTLSLGFGAILTTLTLVFAGDIAGAMNSPEAAPTIGVLGLTLVLAGAGIVPWAMLQRGIEQRKIFVISMIDFVISTTLTLVLLAGGAGVISLAIGRVVAQCVTLVLQHVFTRRRPVLGWDRSRVGTILRFGIPVAAANLLAWTLLNVDNVVVSRMSGAVALGFYVLAFNISNWPMSALGQVVRSVALPGFAAAGARKDGRPLIPATALTWAAALPLGSFLALLSVPLIAVVYGEKWETAAPVLAALGTFGALRALFDLFASYLLSRGASTVVLVVQVVWFATLVPAVIIGAVGWGIVGVGWAHLVVGLGVVLPAYLIGLARTGMDVRTLLPSLWPPVVAVIPGLTVGFLVSLAFDSPVPSLVVGGLAGGIVYALLILRWLLRRIRQLRRSAPPVVDDRSRVDGTPAAGGLA